jgi:hypothetical protein
MLIHGIIFYVALIFFGVGAVGAMRNGLSLFRTPFASLRWLVALALTLFLGALAGFSGWIAMGLAGPNRFPGP